MTECVRLQVSEQFLSLHDRLGNQMRQCSSHTNESLVACKFISSSLIALVFREARNASVVQFFESPDTMEKDAVFRIVKLLCS